MPYIFILIIISQVNTLNPQVTTSYLETPFFEYKNCADYGVDQVNSLREKLKDQEVVVLGTCQQQNKVGI